MAKGSEDVWTAWLFDFDDRLKRLSDLGNQLEAFGKTVDFEMFRDDLLAALGYTSGPPPFDPVMMFKVLVHRPNRMLQAAGLHSIG